MKGQSGLNWARLELSANESFNLDTYWNLSGAPNSSALVDGHLLRLTDSKVVVKYKREQDICTSTEYIML